MSPVARGLSPAGQRLLRDARVARLGTASADGHPLVVPICYAYDDDALFSPIDGKPKRVDAPALKRVRNIQENPRVSVVVDHYDEDWRELEYVIVHGLAELLVSGAEFARGVDLLLAKYPQYRQMSLSRDGGLMVRVRPRSFVHWTFR